jgi:nuclear cap-binding protein subunit 1
MRPWHEEVLGIANLMCDNYDDALLRDNFINLCLQLALEQPLKTPFVAAVVLLVNTNKSELVERLLSRLTDAIEERIAQGEWRDVKLYLKLLGCLQSCLEGDGVFPVLEELFARAVDLQTASSEDVSVCFLESYCMSVLTRLSRRSGPSLSRSSCLRSHMSWRLPPETRRRRLRT